MLFSLLLAEWGVRNHSIAAFYLLPTRGWELLLGGILSFCNTKEGLLARSDKVNNILSFSGGLLIVTAVVTFNDKTPIPSFYLLIPTIGAALIILFANPRTLIGSILASRYFVYTGLISYSAYLWHQPVFVFLRHFLADNLNFSTNITSLGGFLFS